MTVRFAMRGALLAAAITSAEPLGAQAEVARFAGDTTGVAAPCDSTADDTAGWPQARGGAFPASFRMRMPPELVEVWVQSTRGTARAEYRSGPRSLAWLFATGLAAE